MPPLPGIELAVSSDQMFHLESLPSRVVIAGGGYIAVEFAGILAGLGVEVIVVHRGDAVLRGFDDDIRARLGEAMRARGIDLRLSTTVEGLKKTEGGQRTVLSDGTEVDCDLTLLAVGRIPNTEGLGLEAAGVEVTDRGAVRVNDDFSTSQPHIYAIGDLIDRMTLTPVALAEGTVLARALFNDQPGQVDYENIPSAVFSNPTIATVGLTETEAKARYGQIQVFESRFNPLSNTISGRQERTYMKLIVDADSDRVVGCHMLGPDAPEIVQGVAIALKTGATKANFDATIGIHPTAAEEFVTMRTPRD